MIKNYKFNIKNIKNFDKELKKFMKPCKCCGKLKLINNFHKKGKENVCKICRIVKSKKYKYICKQCGKEFNGYKNQQFCSRECVNKYHSEKIVGKNNPTYNRIKCKCDYCGKDIEVTPHIYNRNKHVFCGRKCTDKYRSEYLNDKNSPLFKKIKCNCSVCGKEVYKRPSEIKGKKHLFCSVECKNKGVSIFQSGENHPMYGTKRFDMRGENNINWNPNLTQEERKLSKNRTLLPEYVKWHKEILKRDHWTCQVSGYRGREIVVHHLNSWNSNKEERFDINNAITISKDIHKLFHKLYGYGNNTKEQFEEFKHRYQNGEFEKVV